MRKAFVYRLYPTQQQELALTAMLETHRRLYNTALAERKNIWEREKRMVSYAEQAGHLKDDRRTNPFLAKTNYSSCQATLRRLDRAFQAFFRRVKTGEMPGYPRFKGPSRFDTVEFPTLGDGCKLDQERSRVYFQHIGHMKVKLHRPVEGTIKTLSIRRQADGWHLIASCDLGNVPAEPSTNPPVGIVLGSSLLALVTSNQEYISGSTYYQKTEPTLQRAQQRVSRRKKASKRREKAVRQLAKIHLHVRNQRLDWHYKVAHFLVSKYGTIVCEDLQHQQLVRSLGAKTAYDMAWAQFMVILRHKAEEAGVTVITVPPGQFRAVCSSCGALASVPFTSESQAFHCPDCGHSTDRDVNSARNLFRLGLSRQRTAST